MVLIMSLGFFMCKIDGGGHYYIFRLPVIQKENVLIYTDYLMNAPIGHTFIWYVHIQVCFFFKCLCVPLYICSLGNSKNLFILFC